MYQRIWTMVYSFLMFILVRNAVQYAPLALLYQLAQSGASGGLVDLLILRDETGAYNGYSGDVSSIIAALGFIGGALAVWSTAKLLITKNKEDMHLSHLKKKVRQNMPCWWQSPSVPLSVSTSCLNFWV